MKDSVLYLKQVDELKAAHQKEKIALQRQVIALQETIKALGSALPKDAAETPAVPKSPLPSASEILKDVPVTPAAKVAEKVPKKVTQKVTRRGR